MSYRATYFWGIKKYGSIWGKILYLIFLEVFQDLQSIFPGHKFAKQDMGNLSYKELLKLRIKGFNIL